MSITPVTATNTNYTITGDDIPHSFKQGMAEIDLIARAEKAEADTARLDWLQNSVSLHVNSIALRGDIRDAIDFAMKEASK